MVILGFIAMNFTGSKALLIIAGAVAVIGLIVIASRDRKDIIAYELYADSLLLRRGTEEERLSLEKVVDANLIDPLTARDFIEQHGADAVSGLGRPEDPQRTSTRYCGVAIAAKLSSLSAHSFRQSLVLLRIRDGGAVLLSPRYSERMVRAIGKAKKLDPGTSLGV